MQKPYMKQLKLKIDARFFNGSLIAMHLSKYNTHQSNLDSNQRLFVLWTSKEPFKL